MIPLLQTKTVTQHIREFYKCDQAHFKDSDIFPEGVAMHTHAVGMRVCSLTVLWREKANLRLELCVPVLL